MLTVWACSAWLQLKQEPIEYGACLLSSLAHDEVKAKGLASLSGLVPMVRRYPGHQNVNSANNQPLSEIYRL